MEPMSIPPPPIQAARFVSAPFSSPAGAEREVTTYRPLPPPPSRIDVRPVVPDRWGRLTGLGAETERFQVQQPDTLSSSLSSYALPLACGVLGYLVVGALLK